MATRIFSAPRLLERLDNQQDDRIPELVTKKTRV
jgi:hypothetical protein